MSLFNKTGSWRVRLCARPLVMRDGDGLQLDVDTSFLRNVASPDKLQEFARADGVRAGAVKVLAVWQGPFVLVVPTDSTACERELTVVVSRLCTCT